MYPRFPHFGTRPGSRWSCGGGVDGSETRCNVPGSSLVRESDAVLMDVRGFSTKNVGVVFELNELINVMPIHQVVLIVDRTTDMTFLNQTLENSWANMRADSPNRANEGAAVKICEVAPERAMEIPHVLRSLSAAAS